MASSFRRNTKGKTGTGSASSPRLLLSALPGTKPSSGGLTLTSSGLRDWDQILGGGQPLGTCLWLEQDRWTQSLAATLLKYWCAQAVSHGQHLLAPVEPQSATDTDLGSTDWNEPFLLTETDCNASRSRHRDDIETLLLQLPRNLHMAKEWRKEQASAAGVTSDTTSDGAAATEPNSTLESLQEEEAEDDQEAEEDLKIAWQYKKEVQRERHAGVDTEGQSSNSGTSNRSRTEGTNDTFCQSFDLQGRLSEQVDVMQHCQIVEMQGACNGYEYFQQLYKALPLNKNDRVTRLLLYEPNTALLRTALPLLLSVIREKKLPIVMLVVVKPWQHDRATLISLQRTVDVVLQAEGFASRQQFPPPAEFRMFQGLLRLSKVSTLTAPTAHGGGHFADLTTTKRPASDVYGLKRDRRKLHIQLLHIPPEDYAAGGGSVGGGGVRSGAGRTDKATGGLGCASTGGMGPMDF